MVGGSSLCYLVCPKDVYDLEFDIADNFVMPWLRLWDPEVAHVNTVMLRICLTSDIITGYILSIGRFHYISQGINTVIALIELFGCVYGLFVAS